MDPLTISIASLDYPLLTAISLFFHEQIIPLTLFFILLAVFFERKKTIPILIVPILALGISAIVKGEEKIGRPCALLNAKIPCPPSYSFPSMHAVPFFALALALLETDSFLPFFFIALFVAFTRLYLGVHALHDIAGSFGIALLALSIKDAIIGEKDERIG